MRALPRNVLIVDYYVSFVLDPSVNSNSDAQRVVGVRRSVRLKVSTLRVPCLRGACTLPSCPALSPSSSISSVQPRG